MALKTFVKLNGITNLTDARYGSGMYVNLLGFDLNPLSSSYVNPELYKEITGWVSGVEFVGEFSSNSELNLLETLQEYPSITWIEYDQLDVLSSLAGSQYSLIYKIALSDLITLKDRELEQLQSSGIILHVFSEEINLSEDQISVVKQISLRCKVLLGAGINEGNILRLVDETGIYGISLSGGEETKPGLKDLDELADILEQLETEE